MLTSLTIRNFKRFAEATIELGNPVVLIGPNNSGKTTALQALYLWELGIRRWFERRTDAGSEATERIGVTANRKDVLAAPVPNAALLWRDLHVREGVTRDGKRGTKNVRIEVLVKGVTTGTPWEAGLEFDYSNEESFVVRPLRLEGHDDTKSPDAPRRDIPPQAREVHVAFLPPMSGLAAREFRKERGEINVRIGEGTTAEVLRNLCHQVVTASPDRWSTITGHLERLFGVHLDEPAYSPETSELTLSYRDQRDGRKPNLLDISCQGRGLQQTLLLLAFIELNPGAVVLLDEPDAHLEILRQRQIYQLLTEAARERGCQIVAASHSEVLLEEAADRDVVVAFLGRPHRIDDRGSQLLKSLKEIGFDQYYQAEQTGWVLYLEGATDLAILRAFSETLSHPAREHLERPFLHAIGNVPSKARAHFHGLREAKNDLVGFVLCDRDAPGPQPIEALVESRWKRREIENYLCQPETLLAYVEFFARQSGPGPLFGLAMLERTRSVMQKCIEDRIPPAALRNRSDPWWDNVKASDDFLDPLFAAFFSELQLPNLMTKTDYHVLARHVPAPLIAPEIAQVLDLIVAAAQRAHPAPLE